MAVRDLRDPLPAGANSTLARVGVAWLADQVSQALQNVRGSAVSGRECVVAKRLGAMNQRFMVVGGEVEATVLRIFELLEDDFGKFYANPSRDGSQCSRSKVRIASIRNA